MHWDGYRRHIEGNTMVCSECKTDQREIAGRLEGHKADCSYRIEREKPMSMDYNKAMTLYFQCRRELEVIEGEMAAKVKPLKEKMQLLSQWIEEKARQDGLKNVAVAGLGTGYWTTTNSARVANRTAFKEFCEKNGLWDLMEIRAASAQVRDHIERTNVVPEGVTFTQVQVFHIKTAGEK